jgi:hypothetical protein
MEALAAEARVRLRLRMTTWIDQAHPIDDTADLLEAEIMLRCPVALQAR